MLDLNTYKTRLLSYDEYSITLDRLRMDHLYEEELFFVVAFHTGLKYRDLIKLEWKDVFNKDEFIWGDTLKKKQFTLSWKNTDAKARIFYLYDKLGISDLNSLVFANKSGKCCKIYRPCIVYQHNRIVYISSRKQNRNKINNLSDSLLFTFHLVSSLALGRIQSYFLQLPISCQSRIVQPKEKRTGLWSLPHIFIETCVSAKDNYFYKTIGIWKGNYACLNIVYFDLAYIRLMHKLN